MKKNIGFINLDASLVEWLMEKLKAAPGNVGGADELLEALADLASGNASSLMVESDGTESPVPALDQIVCGELTITYRTRRVTRGGVEISLTPKEFDILWFLARNRGEVFTKEQIYQAVWEDEYLLDDSNIMAFIRKLRKKVEPNPDTPKYILTIWGIGYKFTDDDLKL
ncbi:MAG: winged helix-turn-helix domain-containing protein [Clostridiales bacterium]|nr:winged helix-turn-helix domain-containing protein [Clostridiales bacterium]